MPTNVVSETFEGTPAGTNLALPQQELDDTEARYIQDGLLDYPGKMRRRGPVEKVVGSPAFSRMGTGLLSTLNPLGQARFAVLTGDAANGYFEVLSDDGTTTVALAWPFALPVNPANNQPYFIVDAKPALGGGLLVGVSNTYDANNPQQGVALWMGGNKANYTVTVSFTRGSAAVTGSGFLANVAPGMFLFANTDDPYTSAYIGVVKTVNSDTSITLAAVAPFTGTAKSGTFQSIRGLAPKVTKGRLTTDTNTTTVTGGATKFKSQRLDTGTWHLYRQSDGAFIGKVASVQSEIALTLAANAAVAAANEEYVAIRADADYAITNTSNINKVGFLNATYADRQFYFNRGSSFDKTSWVAFSDTNDPEALDLSDFDGDWFDVTSSSTVNEAGRGVAAAYNGLLLFKENEAFILTGTAPEDFTVRKLEDDGALSGMSIQSYAGGVIWAGREGIHFYDGIQTDNLTLTKLGDYYRNTMRTFDPSKYRMWSMIDRDHYHLFVESISPTVGPVKGSVASTPTKATVVINLATKAVTFETNVDIRGAVTLPASSGKRTWYLVNGKITGEAGRTFGKTSIGANASSSGLATGQKAVIKFALSDNASVKKASAYVQKTGGGSMVAKAVIYADSGGAPGALVATSDEVTISNASAAWIDFTFSSLPTLTPGTYWVGLHGGSATIVGANWYYDLGAAGDRAFNSDSYTDGASNPFGAATTDNRDYSIYVTYDVPDHAVICDGEALFNQEGVDTVTCTGSSGPGPDYYWESKKFDGGDSLRLKRFLAFLMHGLVQGGDMQIDIVLGLNDKGVTLTKTFPQSVYTWTTVRPLASSWTALKGQFPTWSSLVTSVFLPKKFKFSKRSTHISFRVYQATNAITRLEMGPFKVSYKLERDLRI